MRRAAAIRLVDLERRDRDRAGRLGQVHPELAEEAVRPDRGLLDDDHALHERPRRVEQGALREQVAGRVPADVARVRGQVEQLVVGAEHDLDLLDRAAIAGEAVVDPAADQPAAELGERPVQRGPLADLRVAVLERDRWSAAPGGWRPRARSGPRRPPACRSAGPGRHLGGVGGLAGRAELLDDRRRRALAEVGIRVRVSSARSGSPAVQRRTIGRWRWTPAGTSTTTPWLQRARVSWANLSLAGASHRPPAGRGPPRRRRAASAGRHRPRGPAPTARAS